MQEESFYGRSIVDMDSGDEFAELLASKKLHTLIQRNRSRLPQINTAARYDPFEQLYHYIASKKFVDEIILNSQELGLRFDEAACYTITLLLLKPQ